jgi:hypothetical protein
MLLSKMVHPIRRRQILCWPDSGHRRLSASSGSLGRSLFGIVHMDFREVVFSRHLGELRARDMPLTLSRTSRLCYLVDFKGCRGA